MKSEIALRPSYWASVSGGKDSLFMLKCILDNPKKYPLDGVVHFELEIDYPFVKNVVDYMEKECLKYGIRFVRIKPRKTWEEWYNTINSKTNSIYGFPCRKARWCNDKYKLDSKEQLDEFMKTQGYYVVSYIGYCVDETSRYKERKVNEIYPLVELGIKENDILQWAKTQPIFNNFYLTNKRGGCMYCPMSDLLNLAYLYKYYPDKFNYMITKMKETEKLRAKELGRPFSVRSSNPKYNAEYTERIVKEKYIYKLNAEEEKEKLLLGLF